MTLPFKHKPCLKIVSSRDASLYPACFHVHTKRCGHAQNIDDEDYIKKALELGFKSIWFSDHAPFPHNPFGCRMSVESLDEYFDSLRQLKEKYSDKIKVFAGLEAEWLPSYRYWYEELKEKSDFLICGQHFYELYPGEYSFSLSPKEKASLEYKSCARSIVEAIRSGYFDVVAHPDRIFRKHGDWNLSFGSCASEIIDAAALAHVPLEVNIASIGAPPCFRSEFWGNVPAKNRITGFDAHCLADLDENMKIYEMAESSVLKW